MSGPDYSRGYLRVPLDVWLGVFCKAPLTRRQLQLVAFVIRESWGWHDRAGRPFDWTRPLSAAAFSLATGIGIDHAGRELRELVPRGALRETGDRYRFVPEPAEWAVPDAEPAVLVAPPSVSAAPEPGPKKAERQQTNVVPFPGGDRAGAFAAVVAGFAGPLGPDESSELRAWVQEDGAAAVWARLQPWFGRGQDLARQALLLALSEWRLRPDAS